VHDRALAIIDGGKDAPMMQSLGMKPADLRKRAARLSEVRARIAAQPTTSTPRKTMAQPGPYAFDLFGVYSFPVKDGRSINPYMSRKHFDRVTWIADGICLMLVIDRGRAFGFLPWYHAVLADSVFASPPDPTTLASTLRWHAPPITGTCNLTHFKKMELEKLGVFPLDPVRVDHFFPRRAPGTTYAVQDISIANRMRVRRATEVRRWRTPEGKVELIVYPSPPTISELFGSEAP